VVFLIDRVIKEEGFYVHNMYNIVEEHFSISIARSRGGSLVNYLIYYLKIYIRIDIHGLAGRDPLANNYDRTLCF
jgi:hypothetical protein